LRTCIILTCCRKFGNALVFPLKEAYFLRARYLLQPRCAIRGMTEFGSSAGSHQSTNVSLAPPATHLLTYYGHHSAVYLVAWSPVGKYLASGDLQGSIQVWEALTGKRLLTYTAHLDWVDSVAWSPGGKAIASGDAGGSVDVWNATNGQRNSRLMLLPR
jgi:WD40 repeat protein